MYSHQKTVRSKVNCVGIGLHSGNKTNLTINPAASDFGIKFKRTDIQKNNIVDANYLNVTKTNLGTTISNKFGVEISTIEHLMAALWGCGIDNCLIELDGPEVPIMDGSSEPFVFLIECSGITEQRAARKVIEVTKTIRVEENGSYAKIEPYDGFAIDLEIDFTNKAISNQKSFFDIERLSFKNDLCRARTFGFAHEVSYLRSIGLAKGGSLENAVVLDKDGVINEEGLRYHDEFVRHKILDCIGDVYLAGSFIKGKITGNKSGHKINNLLLREFLGNKSAWNFIQPEIKLSPTEFDQQIQFAA